MKRFSDLHLRVLEKGQLTCGDVKRVLGDYVEGELPPSVKARVDSHILSCEKCEKFTASYNQVIELAAELRDRPAPTDVQNRLRQALNNKLGLNLPYIA